jgi:hypothetical protein
MSDLYRVTLDDMISEVERELNQRRQVYARLVAEKKLNRRVADRRYEIMEAALAWLKREKARVETAQPESTQESTPTEAAP